MSAIGSLSTPDAAPLLPAMIETPTPVIDLDKVEKNLRAMQSYCDAHGLKLRPHIKTHKLVRFAQRQLELGAAGITCQKLSEAEVMADAGIRDILISYPLVGPAKARRLAALAPRADLTLAVDNQVALETVAEGARLSGTTLKVLVEFDSGNGRTGVQTVDEALALATAAAQTPNLRFMGLMTYPTTAKTAEFVREAKSRFAAAGVPIEVVSSGGTPGALHTHEHAGITELRVGTYIYNDRNTVIAGAATLEDCALEIYVTVVSRPTPDRAIIDAGTKTLTSDLAGPDFPGYGLILEYPEAVIVRANEEHGMVDLSACARRPEIGEVVRIVPNHVCPVVNLHDRVAVMQGREVIGEWDVSARGMTR